MSERAVASGPADGRVGRRRVWLLVGAGVALLLGANAHLVYVALRSQPECVTHVKPGAAAPAGSTFRAAKSAC